MRRNNYKRNPILFSMLNWGGKGQVAVFVILAVIIVAVVLFVVFYPGIKTTFDDAQTPDSYLRKCIEPEIKPVMEKLSAQGGYLNPEGFVTYNDTKIKYLCYTNKDYLTCVIQQPALKAHFEKELYDRVRPKLIQCANSLKGEYERNGYSVSSSTPEVSVELVPKKVRVNVEMPLTLTKDVSQTFSGFEINVESEMYDLLAISLSIMEFEATYGDSETTLYLSYYPDLKIEKTRLSEGTKIYKLTNAATHESFTFATRSQAWPPGYGTNEI